MSLLKEIQSEFDHQVSHINVDKITEISNFIFGKNVYFTGVGKSGTMAEHCCNLLKSIGIKSYYLSALDALHGDIGTIEKNDVVFFFSKSGNSNELIDIINVLKSRNVVTIGVCCDKNSKFKEYCHDTIELPFKNEIGGDISNIPTHSCMSQLLFSNLLVSVLKNKVSLDKYRSNHPSGNIGHKLRQIKDVIMHKYPKVVMEKNVCLKDVLLKMCECKVGCCLFVDKHNILQGILTDGDIRRLLVKNDNLNHIDDKMINKDFYYEIDANKYIFEIDEKYKYVPFTRENKELVGLVIL